MSPILNRNHRGGYFLYKAVTICVLISFLAGLLPPAVVTTLPGLAPQSVQAAAEVPASEAQAPAVAATTPVEPALVQGGNAVEAITTAPVAVTNASPLAQGGPASISGLVYSDFDADGVKDAAEVGVGGVTVTAYDASGAALASTTTSTTTATLGQYTLSNLPASTPLRLEFTTLPTGYQPGPRGSANGTSVQFVTTTSGLVSNVNFGVNNPVDYTQATPALVTNLYINGDTNATAPTGTLVQWDYSNSGSSPAPTTLATKAQIGATWGLAYARMTDTLYAAALVKRHVGLYENPVGTPHPGEIFKITNAQTAGGSATAFFDVATVPGVNVGSMASNATRGLGAPTAPSLDANTFGLVGKAGLGDLDISEDERTLWTISLNDHKLLAIPVNGPTASNVQVYTMPDPGCTGGAWRPFATKYYRSGLYIGGVCDAQTSQDAADLKAIVYRFEPSTTTWTTVLAFAFDFPPPYKAWTDDWDYMVAHGGRGGMYTGCSCSADGTYNTGYTQPILADIEVDVDGSLILSLNDRYGHQAGHANYPPTTTSYRITVGGQYSRMLRAYNNNGVFVLENNAQAGPLTGARPNSNTGPGGGSFYNNANATLNMNYTSAGGLALWPGSDQVVNTTYDPITFWQGGVTKFSNVNGARLSNYVLYTSSANISTFGKANGVGDIELLSAPAPIEIGNRVWLDTDADGIQDPGELPLIDVQVSRQGPTNTVTTLTDAEGRYYFSNLRPNTAYTLTIDSQAGAYQVTTANANAATDNNAITDMRDSDATLVNNKATIVYTTGGAGENNHSLDFGFTDAPLYDLALIKTLAAGQVMTVTGGSPVTFTLVVKNQGDFNSGTFTVRDQLPTGLTYVSASGAGFNACSNASGVVTCVYPAAGINPGQTVTLTLRANVESGPSNTPYRNWAEISVDSGPDIDSTPDTNTGSDTAAGTGTAPNDAVIDHNDINHAGAAYDQTAEDEDDNDYQDVVVNYDLALIKTLGASQPIKVAPGGQAEFTLTIKNQGNTNSGTFTVRDQLPTGLTYVSASGAGFNACSVSGQVVTCVYPAAGLNPDETAVITLRATVESVTANAPYRNWAEISADSYNDIDSTPDTNTGSDTGPGTGTAPNDPVIDHNDIDHAGAAYDQPSEDEDDNDYQDVVPGVYDLALIKTLGASQPLTVTGGATVTFTLTIKNQGDVDSGAFTVRDQLPTGLTFASATGTNFTCTNASGVVTCPYTGNLASGESTTLTVAATVETTPNNSPYRNWAEISVDSGADVDSTPDTTTGTDTGAGTGTAPNDPVIDHNDIDHVGAAYDERTEDEDDNDYQDVVVDYDLALIKTLAAGQVMTVTPGSPVTFTLVVKNQGNTNSGTFTVRDQLPTGLTYVSASGTGFNACSNASGVVTCVYPATGINPGQTVTVTLRANVETPANNAPYRNWAEISADSGNDIDSTPDTTTGTDTAAGVGTAPNDAVINHDDINHAGAAYDQPSEDEDDNDYQDIIVNYDLALIKTLAPGQVMTVTPGSPVTFTLVVKNQGGINSGTFTVRDQLPTGLTYVSASGAGFNACTQASGVVTCVYPAAGINPGQSVTITLRATVESAITNAPYRNWAEISADSGNDIDSTPDTNTGTDTGVGVGTAPNDPVIDHNDINHAGVAYDQPSEDEDDNDYQDLTAVYDLALIKTLAAGQVMTVTPGAAVTFTLVVKNQGTVNSGAFTVRDQLPTGLTFVSASGAGFNACTNASGVVTCAYPATGINPGQTVTVTLRATVEATPNSNAPYRNWAEISVDSGYDIDSTPDATSGTDTTAGVGTAPNDPVINHDDINHAGAAYDQPTEDEDDNDYQDIVVHYDLALIKTLAPGQAMTVTPGSPVTFTLVVKNQGGVNSGTFTVRDQLPTSLTYVSASGVGFNACSNASGVVTCVYPATGINPGETVTITLRATVEATPNSNAPYRNWAEISVDSGNDIDSTPDTTSGTDTGAGVGTNPNDPVIDHNDINHAGAAYDQPAEDEDDNDYQDIVVNYDLALVKTLTAGQTAITPGGPVTFTIAVKNQGGVNSGTFTVRDQLPTGLTYVSASGVGFNACSTSGQVVTCVYPAAGINPGQTVTITLRASIEATPNNAPYRNWAEISVDSGNDIDSTPDTTSGTDTAAGTGTAPNDPVIDHNDINHAGAAYDQPTEDEDDNDYQDVDIVYDLALIKTLGAGEPLTVTGGSPVTFTVVVKNQGNTNSGTFTVRDQLPAGLTYVAATGTGFNACTQASGVVTCVYPATGINPGQTVTITLNATVEANGINAPYRNWAEISVDSGGDRDSTPDTTSGTDTGVGTGTAPNDPVIDHNDIDHAGAAYDQSTEDEDDNDYQDLNVVYDLALIKTLAPGQLMPVAPGATVDFLLAVKNQGTAQSGVFTVRDQLPTGLTYVSGVGASFTCSVAGQVVTCNYTGNLAPGASATIDLRTLVESATTNAPYRNWAEISSDSGPDRDSTPDTTIGTDTSAGLGTAPNDAVIDHNDIDHADTAYDQPAEDEDDNDYQDVTVATTYDLALIKTLAATQPLTVTPGAPVVFTMVVKNQGTLNSGAFTVRDQLPTGLTYVSATGANFTCSTAGQVVTCTYTGNLAQGATATLTLNTVAESRIDFAPYRNWVEISADSGNDVDSTPDTTTGQDTTPGTGTAPNDAVINHDDIDHAGAAYDQRSEDEDDNDYAQVNMVATVIDLALVKVATPTTLKAGDAVTYTLRIKNQGTVASGPYTVTDRLPTGFTFVAASNSGSHNSGVVTWASLPSLAPNATQELALRVTVPLATTFGDYTNWAEISQDSGVDEDSAPDTNTGQDALEPNDPVIDRTNLNDVAIDMETGDEDDNDPATVTVTAFDLALVKIASPTTVMPGQPITFTLRVQNQGDVAAGALTVRDQLPTGTTFVTASDGGSASSGVVTWNLTGLAASASKDLTLIVLAPSSAGYHTNWAEIAADGAPVGYVDQDSTPDTNTGHDTTVPNDPVIDRTSLADAAIDVAPGDEDDNDLARFLVPGDLPPGSGVLTVTKTVSGTGPSPFTVLVTGPSGYLTVTTVTTATPLVLTGLASGLYTVTEQTTGWTTTYSATTGVSTGSRAVVTLTHAITTAATTPGILSGNVFRDDDVDGIDDGASEPGVAGVVVTAYDRNGVTRGSATSAATGNYSFTPTGSGPYRLELTNLPVGYYPTTHGTGNGTGTQFVTTNGAVSNLNFGINAPADYSQSNPDMVSNVYVNGDTNTTAPTGTLVKFAYNSTGTSPTPTTLATKAQVGSTWGLAYARSTKTIYAAAFLKRHVGLGPNGLGAIYAVNSNGGTPTLFADLAALGVNVGSIPSNSARGLGAPTSPNSDPAAFAQIGKVGLGDIDLSDDEHTLYVVSLNDKTLYALNVPAGTLAGSYAIPDPGCTGGAWRPFGLKYYRNALYVGGVCDAQTSQSASNLKAVTYRFDGSTFTNILDFSLNYTKGQATSGCPGWWNWFPWTATLISCGVGGDGNPVIVYPQPMLSDLEFDVDGSMILGFIDRTGHQTGNSNYGFSGTTQMGGRNSGDILRACNVSGSFVLQGSASCPNKSNNNQGPGGGEYYFDEVYGIHYETSNGGLALLPGSGQVVMTGSDPLNVSSGGIYWMNNQSGGSDRRYQIYGNSGTNPSTFGKATGIGDVELLSDPAPLEIGNRVWKDLNGNGAQDPGEPGINGVQVSLQGPTNTVNVNTSGDGNYYFSNLRPSTSYTLTINPAQTALNSLRLTQANLQAISGDPSNNDPILDTRDSDALLKNGTPVIFYTTGSAGQNNHGLDFGFTQPVSGRVTITNTGLPKGSLVIRKATTPVGSSQTFTVTSNVPGHASFTLRDGQSYTMTQVPIGTYMVTETLPSGWTQAAGTCTNVSTLGAIQVSKNLTTTCTILNALQPTMSNVLTVTKTVNWNGNTPNPGQTFAITITGPSFPSGKADTISAGQTKVYTNVVGGIYTVTETSPGADWVATYSVPSGVINLSTAAIAATTAGPISGNVFRDYNADGVDAGTDESGVAGVIVTAYDPNGVVRGSATTDANGNYSFTPTGSGPYRIEFTNLPAGYYPTAHATNNGTGTQFVTTNGGGANVNLGLNVPSDYCQSNPKVCTTVFANGLPSAGGYANSVVSFDYNINGETPQEAQVAAKSATGAVWGLAYARNTRKMYSSAFVKRHSGLYESPAGTPHPGMIFVSDLTTGATTPFIDLANYGASVGAVPSNSARGLGAHTAASADATVFDMVGKTGLGDIDISNDEQFLWAISLNDKKLFKITIDADNNLATPPAAGDVTSYAIPNPGCTGGNWRPFAVNQHSNAVYVGGVCDANTSQQATDLRAHIYQFNPSTGTFTTLLSTPLTYTKGYAGFSCQSVTGWYAWASTFTQINTPFCNPTFGYVVHPQPMFTDIEFDVDGSLILGFADRGAHQVGDANFDTSGTGNYAYVNGGDVLRACPSGSGGYTLESGGKCNGVGPGGNEYYNGEYFQFIGGNRLHTETSHGGLALKPGSGEVVVSAMDPLDGTGLQQTAGGVIYLNNTTGAKNRAFTVVSKNGGDAGTLGKSGGIGDVELLCDSAPLEIGNRVWNDLNGNGVQDPGEPGLANVTVSLQGPTNTVTTNTDANGLYYFTVRPYTAYTLTINPSQAPLSGLSLTQANLQAISGNPSSNDAILDTRDNDAVTLNGKATILYTTGGAGQNNHGLDFGFTQPLRGQVAITNNAPVVGALVVRKATTPVGSSQTFTVTSNVPGHASFTLRDGQSYTMTQVPVGTYAVTETLPAGWTQAAGACTNVSTLGAVQVSKAVTTTCTLLNALQPTTSNVLTVTKTVNWNGNTPNPGQTFAITITGPSFPGGKADTISAGQTKVYTNVVAGVYTVTETSPGAGWVTTYSMPSGVINLSTSAIAATTAGPIAGNVFRDYDANGVDAGTNEPGVAGVIVTAYDPNGAVSGSATTDANGNYSFTPTGSGPYRLELTNLPVGSYPTAHGAGNGTSTQFITTNGGASNVNFGVNDLLNYSQSNPDLVTPLYTNGDTNSTAPTGALVKFAYNSTGTSPTPTTVATKAQVGSTWGVAYARSTKTLYAAAFLKRHVGLGPNGLGAIYAININGGTPTLFADLAALGANVGTVLSNSARGLGAPTSPNNDATTYAQVGKVGLGDIDISDDERTLYVVSLNDKTLYALNVPAGTLAGSYTIPDPGCTGGAWRPFATKFKNGAVYVGGVCDAQTSQNATNLNAYIYRFTPGPNTFTQVFTFPLNYTKGPAVSAVINGVPVCGGTNGWFAWIDTISTHCQVNGPNLLVIHPQPMLSDLEFDQDGSLILGFMDRQGHQLGNTNYGLSGTTTYATIIGGDILRAYNNNGTYVLESNATAGPITTAGANNGQGPGGGEFYFGENLGVHRETSVGGLAIKLGSGEVALTSMDPLAVTSGGIYWYSNTTGDSIRRYQVFSNATTISTEYLGKANGLGDLELLADLPPLEIGNRVWNDLNGNGVQDPDEPGVNGVQVSLQGPTNTVTVNTSGDGHYYFDNLRPHTAYTLTINPSQAPLSGLSLTQANLQASSGNPSSNDAILDTRDNDAVTVGGKATILYTTGSAGQNNHGLDFGFTQPLRGQVNITNKAPRMDLGDNPDRYNTVITNTGAAHIVIPGLFLGATEDDEDDGQPTADADGDGADEDGVRFPTLKAGNTAIITVTATNTGTQPAILAGWVDFNGNGLFDVSERVTTTVPAGTTNGIFTLTYSVPANAVSDTYARFRLGTDPAVVNPTGVARDGEVEDYPVTVELPSVGSLILRKATTPVGSSQTFTVTSNVPGHASFTLRDGQSYTMTQVPIGTYAVTETLPTGWTQAAGTCTNVSTLGAIQVSKAVTTTCTILNALQPTMSNVLTVTKTVNWNGNTPNPGQTFAITITGPSFPSGKADTITAGQTKVYTNVVAGVYTVTETSPGAGWVTTYSVPSGVVNLSASALAPTTAGPISGNVFRDYDADGMDDGANEPGVAGVIVTAYAPNGAVSGSATTDANGNYSFTPTASGPYRLELTNLPSGSYPTMHGTGNGTGTQFVTTNGGASNVNFGIIDPAFYSPASQQLATSVYINGSITGTANTVARWNYANTGASPAPTQLASKAQVGATYGLAYARTSKVLYEAAFIKRHVGVGPNGIGAIYQIANANGATPGTPSLFVDVAALGIDVGGGASANSPSFPSDAVRGLGGVSAMSVDAAVFDYPGKRGLGDLDISDDEKTLFVVNLFKQSLLAIPTMNPTAANVSVTPIPDPGCVGGSARPFGLKYYHSHLYIGVVCDASVSLKRADLKAVVYRYDPANSAAGFVTVLTVPLTYTKGYAENNAPCMGVSTQWNPWISTYSPCFFNPGNNADYHEQPEPILSDIEFDLDGSMILGFRDRLGDKIGSVNSAPIATTHNELTLTGGDILRAAPNTNGSYTLETNGSVASGFGGVLSSGHSSTDATIQGPGGREFYNDNMDTFSVQETSSGGLALLPGSGEVVVTGFDATAFNEGNILKLSNINGAQRSSYTVFGGTNASNGYFGKANGLGDLELLVDPAPLEIGNRVWKDLNGNGVQDGGEPGIVNVTVALQSPTNTVTTNTDANGLYYFTVSPNTAYTLTINPSQATLSGLSLTQANTQAISGNPSSNDALLDTRDSDAVTIGGKATIFYTTSGAGQNNHGLDFGFIQPLSGQVTIGNSAPPKGSLVIRKATTPVGSSQPFTVTSNVPGHASFTLRDGQSYTMTDVPVGTYAVTETLPTGWTQAASTCTNVSTLGTIQVSQNLTTTCSIINAQQPTVSNVLTVTKTVNWNGNTPNPGQTFAITITGPSFRSGKADTISAGQTKVYTNVVAGVYTVTETSPGAGWVITYSVPSGVVNLSSAAIVATTAGPISGNVFRDYNADGVDTGTSETGVAGVTVTAYAPNGAVSGSATTDASGNYSFTPTASGPYRLELTNLPTGYYPTAHGTGNGTGTQFVTTNGGASNLNFGVNAPADYNNQSNPDVVANVYINGDTNTTEPTGTLVKFAYNDTGTSPTPTTLATKAHVGSTWGLAYARMSKTIYAAAFLKRHVGLGPNGLGAIYAINSNGGTPTLFADLAALGANVGTVASNSARGLGDSTLPNSDTAAFAQIGKVGLGDIDLSDDEHALYVVSLNDKTLYVLNVPAGTLAGSYAIPDPGCTGGAWRPFGLKYYRGVVYVGGVCDAQTAQNEANLRAYVLRFTPVANTFTQVFTFPLNYPRPAAVSGGAGCDWAWNAWLDVLSSCGDPARMIYPQPMLSDIEFDGDGSMILGFNDRTGHQFGRDNYGPAGSGTLYNGRGMGDILRAYNNKGTYVLENNATAGSLTTAGANNNEGPGGGEFYYADGGADGSVEAAIGGLALKPGSGEVGTSFRDPVSLAEGGVAWLNTTTGARTRSYELFPNESSYFAKASGVGDLELLLAPAPLQIGNRVWKDLNSNGVQDPGEPGLANVTVSLQSPTNTVTTNTDANGLYYFTVSPNTAYTLTINPSQATLSGLTVTQANLQAISGNPSSNDAILDTRDSDAVTVSGKATIFYTTGSAGQNNHGLDFGFTQPLRAQVGITNKAPRMDLGDNPDRYNTVITNTGAAHVIVAGLFLGAAEDDENDGQPNAAADGDGADEDGVQFPTLKAGSSAVITVTATNTGTQAAILAGWLDFNGDGLFDVSERVTTTVPAGTTDGIFILTYSVPANAVSDTYARFRLSTDPVAAQPTGVARNGEVEDYPVHIQTLPVQFGDRVWIESDRDGLAASGVLTPVVGLIITATNGSKTYTTQTDSQGYYSFTVDAGTYTVTYGSVPGRYGVVLPSSTPGGNRESGSVGSYRAGGNPDRSHANGTTVTLTPGQANWQLDFAFHAPQVALRLVKQVTPQVAKAGETLTYTLVLTNDGPDSATGVQVQDLLPTTVTYQSATPQQGTYDPNTGIWDVGTVAAGSTVTLSLTVTVN